MPQKLQDEAKPTEGEVDKSLQEIGWERARRGTMPACESLKSDQGNRVGIHVELRCRIQRLKWRGEGIGPRSTIETSLPNPSTLSKPLIKSATGDKNASTRKECDRQRKLTRRLHCKSLRNRFTWFVHLRVCSRKKRRRPKSRSQRKQSDRLKATPTWRCRNNQVNSLHSRKSGTCT